MSSDLIICNLVLFKVSLSPDLNNIYSLQPWTYFLLDLIIFDRLIILFYSWLRCLCFIQTVTGETALQQNTKRVVDVWLDEYKDAFNAAGMWTDKPKLRSLQIRFHETILQSDCLSPSNQIVIKYVDSPSG